MALTSKQIATDKREILLAIAKDYTTTAHGHAHTINWKDAWRDRPDWAEQLQITPGEETPQRLYQAVSYLRREGAIPEKANQKKAKVGRPKGKKDAKLRKSPLIGNQKRQNGHHANGAMALSVPGPMQKPAMAPMAVQMLQSLLVQTLLAAATAIESGDVTLGVKGGQ